MTGKKENAQPISDDSGGTTVRRRVYPRKNDVVLEAAERAFLESGFAGTSMDAVALAAGVSKRTVYSNFGSKHTLFAEVIKKRCAEVLPDIPDLGSVLDLDPAEVLQQLGTRFLKAIYTPEQIALYRTVVTEARTFPEIGAMMYDGPIMHSQGVFDAYLRAQVDRGVFDFPDIDLAAAQLVGLFKTNIQMRLLMNQPIKLSSAKIAAIAKACVQLFLHGALAKPKR